MSLVAIEKAKLTGIGDAIRENLGTEKLYTLDEIKSTVKGLGRDGQFFPMNMLEYCLPTMTLTYNGEEI